MKANWIIGIGLTIITAFGYADSLNMIAGTWTTPASLSGYTRYNNGGYPSTNQCLIQGIRTVNATSRRPVDDQANLYVDVANGENRSTAVPEVGTTGARNGYTTARPVPAEPGEYVLGVAGNAGQNGYCRLWSSMVPTNSAYFINTPVYALAAVPPVVRDLGTLCTNISPVYKGLVIIPLQGTTQGWAYGAASPYAITGQCQGVVIGGNSNALSDTDVMVYWRTNNTYAWEPIQNFGLSGAGAWTGTYRGGSEVMIGMRVGGSTALPSSLGANQTPGPVFFPVIPEPGLAIVGVAIAFLLKKR